MDERDMRIANLRAQVDGQTETIRKLEAEITRLRKRDVEITQLFEDVRDRYTGLMGGIMELQARLGQGEIK